MHRFFLSEDGLKSSSAMNTKKWVLNYSNQQALREIHFSCCLATPPN